MGVVARVDPFGYLEFLDQVTEPAADGRRFGFIAGESRKDAVEKCLSVHLPALRKAAGGHLWRRGLRQVHQGFFALAPPGI